MKNSVAGSYLPFIAGILLFFSSSAPSAAQGSCPLSLAVSHANIQQLTISDLDFEHFESRTLLFTLNIKNDTDVTVSADLKLVINIRLANGNQYEPAYIFSHDGISVNPGTLTLTNLDFNGSRYRLRSEDTPYEDAVRENVQDVALATGKFPSGRYSFYFTLENGECGVITSGDPLVLDLENPTRVELISPRDGETTSPFPMFEFFHDGQVAELTVAELRPEQSREDAISQEPPMNKAELAGNSFLYGGGRPLEEGKTYVWKVVTKLTGPSGSTIEVSSPIGLFHVSSQAEAVDPEVSGLKDKSMDEILKILESMFGHKYPDLIASLKKTNSSFDLSTLDGASMSKADLITLLKLLQSGGVEVNLNVE